MPWSINIIAADAIIQGLKEKDYINNSIKYVKDEKEYLYRALKEIQVLKVLKPSVNFIMFKLLIDLDLKGELIKRKILNDLLNLYNQYEFKTILGDYKLKRELG